ncbi:MAG: hypothetical protein JXA23_00730 [Bacteroidales bacterium]|nr:hypothetical protein [Bacteroidales bacterium]
MRLRRIHLLITLFLVCRAAGIAGNEVPGEALTQRVQAVSFIENKGQIIDQDNLPNPGVLYLLNRPGMNVHLRRGGFSYDLYSITRQEETSDPGSAIIDPGSGIWNRTTLRRGLRFAPTSGSIASILT